MKTIHLILVSSLLLLSFISNAGSDKPDKNGNLDKSFTLQKKEEINIDPPGLIVELRKIQADNSCPCDKECENDSVSVIIKIKEGKKVKDVIYAKKGWTYDIKNTSFQNQNYELIYENIETCSDGEKMKESDYKITLKVQKKL